MLYGWYWCSERHARKAIKAITNEINNAMEQNEADKADYITDNYITTGFPEVKKRENQQGK